MQLNHMKEEEEALAAAEVLTQQANKSHPRPNLHPNSEEEKRKKLIAGPSVRIIMNPGPDSNPNPKFPNPKFPNPNYPTFRFVPIWINYIERWNIIVIPMR